MFEFLFFLSHFASDFLALHVSWATEVDYFDLVQITMEQDVLILEISVSYFVGMNALHCLTNLLKVESSESVINESISMGNLPKLSAVAELHQKVEIVLIFESSH